MYGNVAFERVYSMGHNKLVSSTLSFRRDLDDTGDFIWLCLVQRRRVVSVVHLLHRDNVNRHGVTVGAVVIVDDSNSRLCKSSVRKSLEQEF